MNKFRSMSMATVLGALVLAGGSVYADEVKGFTSFATGAEEVPARITDATGQATFDLAKGGNELAFTLNVQNIENVVMAHIHCGPAGERGPIIAWLYDRVPAGGGAFSGELASGTLTEADVVVVPPSDVCKEGVADFAGLIAKLKSNEAYVVVHTDDGVAPDNTGPGDFLAGEIRGHIH